MSLAQIILNWLVIFLSTIGNGKEKMFSFFSQKQSKEKIYVLGILEAKF